MKDMNWPATPAPPPCKQQHSVHVSYNPRYNPVIQKLMERISVRRPRLSPRTSLQVKDPAKTAVLHAPGSSIPGKLTTAPTCCPGSLGGLLITRSQVFGLSARGLECHPPYTHKHMQLCPCVMSIPRPQDNSSKRSLTLPSLQIPRANIS